MRLDPVYSRLQASLARSWRLRARPEQLAPDGDWLIWLYLAGRGSGKTRSGAEWVHEMICSGQSRRMALVAPTAADVRKIVVEGESGILATAPDWNRPTFEPSRRRISWANGATADLFSSEEPDRLRGPQHDAAWADEMAAWQNLQETWDQLQFGMRLGQRPRQLVTTTPRPVLLIKKLLARAVDGSGSVVVTRGCTSDNAANLAPSFMAEITERYGGTRLGRQELDGELLEDVQGALWNHDNIDRHRVERAPDLQRIVVAVDPAVTSHEGSDETGIVVAGVDAEKHVYILADLSARLTPTGWARRVVSAYEDFDADRVLAERNMGGEMVQRVLQTEAPNIPYRAIHASRGKVLRAEPVSALYEQGKVHHVGTFADLEDQQCTFTPDFSKAKAGFSPDRVDALVYAVTELTEYRRIPTLQIAPMSGLY